MKALRRAWIWLTYWRVACESCRGTGVCHEGGITQTHSCCGDCWRKRVPLAKAPWAPDKVERERGYVITGDGVMYRRPWSRRQVMLP